MRAFLLSFIFLISLQYKLVAQENKLCVTDEVQRELAAYKPSIKEKNTELEAFTQTFIQNNSNKTQAIYIIPVVFHIIHQNGPENISDAMINEAIQFLNVDFTATNSDLSKVVPSFQSIIGNAGIEFRLAKKIRMGIQQMELTESSPQKPM